MIDVTRPLIDPNKYKEAELIGMCVLTQTYQTINKRKSLKQTGKQFAPVAGKR